MSQVFETPDKENAIFVAGQRIAMNDSHADFPALVLGNYILGQGASSRLFGRIRGKEGLSYGVGSQFNAPVKSNGARFAVQAISAPQNASKVEASFRRRGRDGAARRLLGRGSRDLEGLVAPIAPSIANPRRRADGLAARGPAQRPHDGVGRRSRCEGRRAEVRGAFVPRCSGISISRR